VKGEVAMAIVVRIPTPLQKFTKNQSEVSVQGVTVADVLDNLEEHFPGLRERLVDDRGSIRKFINFYLNDEDIRFMDAEQTTLKDGDELSIIPAIAGGCA
jgi:molybdopterin synthase sulfur carrier subunit